MKLDKLKKSFHQTKSLSEKSNTVFVYNLPGFSFDKNDISVDKDMKSTNINSNGD